MRSRLFYILANEKTEHLLLTLGDKISYKLETTSLKNHVFSDEKKRCVAYVSVLQGLEGMVSISNWSRWPIFRQHISAPVPLFDLHNLKSGNACIQRFSSHISYLYDLPNHTRITLSLVLYWVQVGCGILGARNQEDGARMIQTYISF